MIPTKVIDTERDLERMIKDLKDARWFAWDHETRSSDYQRYPNGALRRMTMKSDLVSFAHTEQAYVIPLGMKTIDVLPEDVFFPAIRPIMEDKTYIKLGWNSCFDMHGMANYDVWVTNYRDVMILGYLLDTNRSNSLKERCTDVGMELHKYNFKNYWKCRALVTGEIERKPRMKKFTHEDLVEYEREYIDYSAQDSIATMLLWNHYYPQVQEMPKVWNIFIKLRNPAVRTLFNMERRGIPVDKEGLIKEGKVIEKELEECAAKVYEIAGEHFNIGSPKDLPRVLYEEMSLPVYRLTANGKPSTDEASLDRLAQEGHDIAQAIVKWRKKRKLLTTYFGESCKTVSLIYDWSNSKGSADYKLHPSYNITGTRTGRLSSSDPNAQNFLKNLLANHYFRNYFVASPGHVLVGGDFSQIELRIMAHLSMDPAMCAEYRKDAELKEALDSGMPLEEAEEVFTKSDIHTSTAETCRCSRDLAKVVNFGIIYGMYPKSLGFTLTKANWDACLEEHREWDALRDTVDEDMARDIYEGFFRKYAGVKTYQKVVGERAKIQGYIETRYGQRRHLPDVWSSEWMLVSAAMRQAVNTTIQGHVGELMLLLMNRVERDPILRDLGFRQFMQVHDEVLGEAPKRNAEECKRRLTYIFQNPQESTESFPYSGYRVPLIFEAKAGSTWGKVH